VYQLPADINSYIIQRLNEVLPSEALVLLRRAAEIAAKRKWSLYLVGGYVRDCLLKIPDYDIDVAVVGDAPRLASLIAGELGSHVETHPDFGTAVLLSTGGNFDIDIVTARHEEYERPGALPTVTAGTIEDDLARRDFTVNAMAVGIKPDAFGPFLDSHNGLADLENGLIRVLHPQSYRDDPTRIFRAVKLAKRLDFKIERDTLELILQAVRDNALATVSMERITHELLLIMEESKGGAILAELDKLGVLSSVHPSLAWPYQDGRMGPPETDPMTRAERRDTYLAIIAAEFASAPEDAEALARWLKLPAPQIKLMRDAAKLAELWTQLGADNQKPSETYHLLYGLDPAALQAYTRIKALAKDTVPWSRLHDYLDRLRHIHPAIKGDYLRDQGVPPGPIYKRLLRDLLDAKLDGELPTRENEERFVREWLAKEDEGRRTKDE
jgi:tRNA nucleotidyltransferase (CCA-adding enzyme)